MDVLDGASGETDFFYDQRQLLTRVDDALGNTGYYGTMFMTHDEIRRKWSRWFSVDRIIPAYVGNHQDLVVLRRR